MFYIDINKSTWFIKEISQAEMDSKADEKETIGLTVYTEQTIYLVEHQPNKSRTLKHELTHVWLYENGHNQHEKEFNHEDICEIVACITDFIQEAVDRYMSYGGDVI